jgi:hypothetical protein
MIAFEWHMDGIHLILMNRCVREYIVVLYSLDEDDDALQQSLFVPPHELVEVRRVFER